MLSLSEKAWIAQWVYDLSGPGISSWRRFATDFVPFSQGGTAGAVLIEGKHAIIAFRGTELSDIQDLITDLKTYPVANKKGPGQVHAGTQEALLGVWPQIIQILNEREVQSVELLGHSLGGMIATLAATWLYIDCENVAITGVTTFGSPPIGDKVFANALRNKLGGKLCDIINSVDIVPRLITPRVMGFRRAGTVYYLPEGGGDLVSGSVIYSRVYDLIAVYSKAYFDWVKSRKFTAPGIARHSIKRYRVRLEGINL